MLRERGGDEVSDNCHASGYGLAGGPASDIGAFSRKKLPPILLRS
jgi:hypothetical protein